MAFWGLMTVKRHNQIVANLQEKQAEQRSYWRSDTNAEREAVARLVGQNAGHLTTIARLRQDLQDECNAVARLANQNFEYLDVNAGLQCEVKALRAELAGLKAVRERQLANLAKGSAASAQARKQRSNGEGV